MATNPSEFEPAFPLIYEVEAQLGSDGQLAEVIDIAEFRVNELIRQAAGRMIEHFNLTEETETSTETSIDYINPNQPNRTGFKLNEVTARQMSLTIGAIHKENGGSIGVEGSTEPTATGPLSFVFYGEHQYFAFMELLDDYEVARGSAIELHQIIPDRQYYQLHSPEAWDLICRMQAGDPVPENVLEVLETDKKIKYDLADYLIEQRDQYHWAPE